MSLPKEIELLPRKFMARAIYLWLLVMFFYFFIHNSLVHQWRQPPLIYPQADNVYWVLHILNIPQFIMGSAVASSFFDIVMIASTFLFFLFPQKTIFCFISVICYWLFQIMFGTSAGHHFAHVGFLIIPMPFIFLDRLKFTLTWKLVRYWILFLYAYAGICKFYYGGFFHEENMTALLRQYVDKESILSPFILYLVYHPFIAQLFYQFGTILEVSCIIGFFTEKFDKWIALSLFMFHLSLFLLKAFPFWENSFVIASFLPWDQIQIRFKSKLAFLSEKKHL